MAVHPMGREQALRYAGSIQRYLHQHPELSGQEDRTAALVQRELERMGIRCHRVGAHNVIGVLEGGDNPRTLAFRSELDALPIAEATENLTRKKQVVSQTAGVSHSCGHDFHMAMLLAAAGELAKQRHALQGRILFCFESGEETAQGFPEVLAFLQPYANALVGVFGIHLWNALPTGQLAIPDGPCMAGQLKYDVTVVGRGGHGARPKYANNPIYIGAELISGLEALAEEAKAVLSVGTVHSGSARNLIPETAELSGTVRFFALQDGLCLQKQMEDLAAALQQRRGCQIQIAWTGPFPVVRNDSRLSRQVRQLVKTQQLGEVVESDLWTASDTFGRYTAVYPGVYVLLGCGNREEGYGAEHHNPHFEADPRCLAEGIALYDRIAMAWLGLGNL